MGKRKTLYPKIGVEYTGYLTREPIEYDNKAVWTGKKTETTHGQSKKFFVDILLPANEAGAYELFSSSELRKMLLEAKVGAWIQFTFHGQVHTGRLDKRGEEFKPYKWDAIYLNPENLQENPTIEIIDEPEPEE